MLPCRDRRTSPAMTLNVTALTVPPHVDAASATASRRARHRSLCAGQEHRARRCPRVQAVVQRDAARPEPATRSRPIGRSPTGWRTIRTAPRRALREAIGRAFGLDPDRIVCGAGSDDLLNLLADAYLCDGDEAIHTTHGFLVYPIATLGSGAKPVVAAEKNYTADVDAILAARERAHQDRLPRQSEQSDRHLCAVRRDQAAASRAAAATCCWCSTPPMRNTCAATTTNPASSWSPPPTTWSCAGRSRRSTAWRRCGSAGCTGRRMWSMPSTASAGRSTSTRPRWRPASPPSRTAPMSKPRARTTTNGWPGSARKSASSGSR